MAYVLTSDQHAHAWSQFAMTDSDGVNSRLNAIRQEIVRAAWMAHDLGSNRVYGAGDLFHTRGAIKPSVFNPVRDTLWECHKRFGTEFRFMAGNHDLESNDSQRLTNACTALVSPFVEVNSEPFEYPDDKVIMIPWVPRTGDLLTVIAEMREGIDPSQYDLIIHAGIDGVLSGVPGTGLTGEKLAEFGFKRVFAGHYHHHVEVVPGVYSIGALTHQTWSDVDTQAGFLSVGDEVEHHEPHAPRFVDITDVMDCDDAFPLEDYVLDNFVRVRGESWSEEEIRSVRDKLMWMGAAGVVVHATAPSSKATARTGAVTSSASLESSIGAYVNDAELEGDRAEIAKECLDILSQARAAS